MISATEDSQGQLRIEARLGGIAAYLDNYAVIELAKGNADRRQAFVDSIHKGGALLFSGANAVELAGPKGASRAAVLDFLEAIGARWIPIELAPWDVSVREQAGIDPSEACVDKDFLSEFYRDRHARFPQIDPASDDFWNLRWAVDWTAEQGRHFLNQLPHLDAELGRVVEEGRRRLAGC